LLVAKFKMDRPRIRSDVFRQLDCLHLVSVIAGEQLHNATNRLDRTRLQLPARRRIAEVVARFAIEAHTLSTDVEPGAHSVATFRRGGDLHRSRQHHTGNARERVGDDVGLEHELPLVGDVGKRVSATSWVDQRLSTIAVRFDDIYDCAMHDVAGNTLNAGTYALARNRAAYEDNTPFMAREHAAARNDLFRNEHQLRAWG
jgi:hypothetical protein